MENQTLENWLEKKGKKAIVINDWYSHYGTEELIKFFEYLGVNYDLLADNVEMNTKHVILLFNAKGLCTGMLEGENEDFIKEYTDEYSMKKMYVYQ